LAYGIIPARPVGRQRAGDGVRTHDNDVGNVVLYQLSYTRLRDSPDFLTASPEIIGRYARRSRAIGQQSEKMDKLATAKTPPLVWRGRFLLTKRTGGGPLNVVFNKVPC
jgi:hypothetical protein